MTDIHAMREHLAVEVMGWWTATDIRSPYPHWIGDDGNGIRKVNWKPDENAEQSRWLLSCFSSWEVNYRLGVYACVIDGRAKTSGMGEGDYGDLYAICIAACRASGMEVEG